MSIKKTTPDNLQVSPSLQIQYAAQVALQRCLILRIDKAYTLYHFPCYLSIDLISNSIFCPTLGGRFTPAAISVSIHRILILSPRFLVMT